LHRRFESFAKRIRAHNLVAMRTDIRSHDSRIDAHAAGVDSWRKRARHWLIRRTSGETKSTEACEPLPGRGIHRVLISRVSHTLGNTLLITPLIREIERAYPGAEIDVITRSSVAQAIFGSFARVRTIFQLPHHGVSSPHRIATVLHTVRKRSYDLAIDPGLQSTTDRVYVKATRAHWRIGYASKLGGGLTQAIANPTDLRHVGKLPVYLLRAARNEEPREAYPNLDIALSVAERARGRATLEEIVPGKGPVIGLFTAATGDKNLGAAWWQAFAAQYVAVVPGARLLEMIPLVGGSALEHRWSTYYSTDVRRMAGVISAVARFIAADCGVMHLACAAGAPTVGLFRGTQIMEWGPYGSRDLAFDVTSMPPEAVANIVAALHHRPVY
jgi:ADP-heptose:LPS heptosyltransferase